MLGKDPAELTKDERNVAKMVNFGIIYGISAFGLSENLEIPREQAQEYIDTYLARFPHVQDFIQRTIEQAERDGYVTTLLGRRRPVPEIRARNRQTRALGERLAVNSVMQGTAADIIKVAMIRIHDRLREEGRGARLVLQVHDELLLEAPETETSAIKELVREEMCGAYPLDPPLAVDVGVGDDWNEAKSSCNRLLLGLGARADFGLYSATRMANDTMEKPIAAEEGVWVTGPDGELIPDYESTFPTINEGEVVHGTVVRVDKDEVLVDIGYKSEGVIPVAELSIRRSVNPADEVSVGEEIDALVLTKEDAEGRLILSKKRARFELAWKKIEAAAESGEPVVGRVIEVVKGGLILDLGVRGFLPASLVDIRRVQDLDEFMATELRCKVIELNRSRNNVVLSRRAVLEDERKDQRQQILDRLNPGDIVDGTISNIVDFGAFVDLNGMDGLIHISELSWSHVNHPSEVLEIGQEVKVKVLDIDRDRQRISLGLKQTQSDPWQQVLESYSENDVVEGRVTKVVTFGAFVEILPGVEGLVHISELAQHHVENPREVVSQGDAVNVLILEVDAERRRLSLSLKRVEEGQEPLPRADGGESVHLTPNLNLSEDVFPAGAVEEAVDEDGAEVERRGRAGGRASRVAEAETELTAEAAEPVAEAEPAEAEPTAEVELEDTPAPESDAAAEVELEAETTAAAEAAAGDEPVDEPTAESDAATGDEPDDAAPRSVVSCPGRSRSRSPAGSVAGKSEALYAFREGGRRDGVERRDRPPPPPHRPGREAGDRARAGRGRARRRRRRQPQARRRDRLRRPREARLPREAAASARHAPSTCAGASSSPGCRTRPRSPSPRCRSSTRPAATSASTRWS